MSFSSAQWTIPELCVWIVTGNREALNALSPRVRDSLKYVDMVHSGAYAARDRIIEAAQQGSIIITCAGESDRYRAIPDRVKLPKDFWNNAELVDAGHWEAPGAYWCVARGVDQPTTAKAFRDLLVDSSKAKEIWGPHDMTADKERAESIATGEVALRETAQRPIYQEPVTYSSDRVPSQFQDWVRMQAGATITVDMAEDAMRGARDEHGHRSGGLLAQGTGLSRDTIREWVKITVPEHQQAKQGEPPSRAKKR